MCVLIVVFYLPYHSATSEYHSVSSFFQERYIRDTNLSQKNILK